MFGMGKQKIYEDPCIDQIVQFVRAVSGIKKKDGSSAWIDFYGAPLEVEIVCRYFEFGDCSLAGLVYDYSHNTYPNGNAMLEAFSNQFSAMSNLSSFPNGTQLEIKNKDGNYDLTFHVVPMYKNQVKKYRSVIADAIRNTGLSFMDGDRKGKVDPNRIYIEEVAHYESI